MKPSRCSCLSLLAALLSGAPPPSRFAADTPGKEIVNGSDQFELVYLVKLPQLSKAGQLWRPLAKSDSFQTVEVQAITAVATFIS